MFKPIFTITAEINQQIATIEGLKTVIGQASILPTLEIQLRLRATVEAVHSSTSIEGNPLNEQQVQKVLEGKTITAPDYAIVEVVNYKHALDWINNKVSLKNTLTVQDVLDLHKIVTSKLLPPKKSGHFRPGDIFIVDEINGKEIVQYQGPEANSVPKLVASFLKWVSIQEQSSLHPILLAALIHYLFVSIHPFADGNGRSARLITYYYLRLWNYDFRGSLSLDSYYLQHRLKYYQALNRGKTFDERMTVDLSPFLEFFTKGFLEVTTTLSQYIKIGKIAGENKKPIRLDADELAIIDFVYQFGSITAKEAVDILSTPKRTTQRRLMNLVAENILRIEGQGPATRYVLDNLSK